RGDGPGVSTSCGRPVRCNRPAMASARDEPHNESARRQGTPRERTARTSSKAAQRVNTDSADTIITREDVSQVPSAERGVNAAPASAGALRQVEGQRLQLDRQVHVLQADVL